MWTQVHIGMYKKHIREHIYIIMNEQTVAQKVLQ